MKGQWKIALLALAFVATPASADAPFCVVSQTGQQQCFYYTLDACRQAAATFGGACAVNQQPQQVRVQPSMQIQSPDIVGNFQRGYENGARMKQQQEEHAMRMQLMQAQTDAMRTANAPAPSGPSYKVIYACPSDSGESYPSEIPLVGCVVTDIQF